MIMTRGKDDPKELYDLLGTKEYRKELDRQFKNAKSNFKIAIVVDMWLTGFDVPFLDTIYIDKPIQRHNLIQTISRVNRKYRGQGEGAGGRLHRHQEADEPGPGALQQGGPAEHRGDRAVHHRGAKTTWTC